MATTTRPSADVAYLCRALKAPAMGAAVERLAERARSDNWTHEEFLAACLEREVASRQANGGELRIRAARFPARKTLEEFSWRSNRVNLRIRPTCFLRRLPRRTSSAWSRSRQPLPTNGHRGRLPKRRRAACRRVSCTR